MFSGFPLFAVAKLSPFFYIVTLTKNDIQTNGTSMARMCEICGKKPVYGNNISHAHNLTRRRWEPNLQVVRARVNGRTKRMTVCTTCIKSNKVTKVA